MKKLLLLLLLTGLFVRSSAQGQKVLFIGIDGCLPAAVNATNSPTLASLEAQGTYSHDALTLSPTYSAPGWGSMLTGYWNPNRMMVIDNSFSPCNYATWPHLYKRLKTINPTLKTASIASWSLLNPNIVAPIGSACDYTYNAAGASYAARDLDAKNKAVAALGSTSPDYDLVFVHFDQVDGAGHSSGFSTGNAVYTTALNTVDGYVTNLLAAMQSRPNFASEKWLVVVSTDHGGTGTGHGSNSLAEENIFVIFTDYNSTAVPAGNNLSRTSVTAPVSSTAGLRNAGGTSPKRYASIPKQAALHFGANTSFTIECRVKSPGWSNDPAIISDKNWASGANTGFVLAGNTSGGTWKFNMGDGTNRLDLDGRVINDNNWHHIAVVTDRQRGMTTLYQDGVPYGSVKNRHVGNINTTLPINITQDGTGNYGNNFNGSVNEVRIWNTALTEATLVQWANTTLSNAHPNAAQLVGYYKMGEGSGTVINDSKAAVNGTGANNGNLVSTVSWTNQAGNITINNYSNTPKMVDIVPSILDWMCYDYQSWGFDGHPVISGLCNQPACAAPTGLNATSITGFQAWIHWAHANGIRNYTVEYKPVSSTTWISAGTTGTDSLLITGLSPRTTYDYRVKAACSGYSTGTFSTINELKTCFNYDFVTNTWPAGTLSKTFTLSATHGLTFTETLSGALSEITLNTLSSEYSTDSINGIARSVDVNFNGAQPDSLDFNFVFSKPVKVSTVTMRDLDRSAGSYTDVVRVQGRRWDNTPVAPAQMQPGNPYYVSTGNASGASTATGYSIPQTPDAEGHNGDLSFGFDTLRMKSYRITYLDSISNPTPKGFYYSGFCISFTPPYVQPIANAVLASSYANPPVQPLNMLQYADDDGAVDSLSFTALPNPLTEGTLYLNGVAVTTLAQVTNIPAASLAQLSFKPIGHYSGAVVLSYYAVDNDGYRSAPASYSIPVADVLPVRISDFTAVLSGADALLQWTIGERTGLDHFVVERSGDGLHYSPVARVAATADNSYELRDRGITAGKHFYRISIRDQAGNNTYSPIRLVQRREENPLLVYPNPTGNLLTVSLGDGANIRRIRIFNASSQLVYDDRAGHTSVAEIPAGSFGSGLYLLEITDEAQQLYRSSFLKK